MESPSCTRGLLPLRSQYSTLPIWNRVCEDNCVVVVFVCVLLLLFYSENGPFCGIKCILDLLVTLPN